MDATMDYGRPALTDNDHDDHILESFWVQMRNGDPLTESQARHLFRIGFEAGYRATLAKAQEVGPGS